MFSIGQVVIFKPTSGEETFFKPGQLYKIAKIDIAKDKIRYGLCNMNGLRSYLTTVNTKDLADCHEE